MKYTIKLLKYLLITFILLLIAGSYLTAFAAGVTAFASVVIKDFSALLFTGTSFIIFILLGTVFVDIINILDKRWFD